MRWYDKMVYALAHSIPGRTMWEKVFLGQFVMASTGLMLAMELEAVAIRLSGLYFVLPSSEAVLWVVLIVATLVARHFTIGADEVEELEVSYRERREWTQRSWGVVVAVFVVIPFVLIVWSHL